MARWIRGIAATVMLAVMLLAGAACGAGDEAASTDPRAGDRVLLEVTPAMAASGASLELRVVAPAGEPYEYGLAATLERREGDDTWTPTHHLSLGGTLGSGGHAPFDEPLVVFSIAYPDERPLTVALPAELPPGTYRVVADATVGDPVGASSGQERVVARSAELTITG